MATIFPMNIQRIRKGKIIDERKKITTAINSLNNNVTSINRLHTKSLSVGNKKIGDIQVVESHSSFYEVIGERKLITVLEVILMINQIDTSSFIRITDLFDKYLLGYSDYRLKAYVQDEYPRSAYIKLSEILNSMKIPNKVLEMYVFKKQYNISNTYKLLISILFNTKSNKFNQNKLGSGLR